MLFSHIILNQEEVMGLDLRSTRALVVTIFTVCALLAAPQTGLADARLSTDIVPTFEHITLKIDAAQLEYTGTAEFDLDVTAPVNTFDFHAEGIRIDSLALEQDGQTIPVTFAEQGNAIVAVTASASLKKAPAHMRVAFTNWLDTTSSSLYQVFEGEEPYSFTQFEPDDARGAFPCWDEPSFKIPFKMTLIVPETHTAVFNTPVEAESVTDGWRTIAFRKSPPLPAYLLAFATGPLESVPIPGMSIPGNVVCVKGSTGLTGETVKITPPILKALEAYFGENYPYAKLDIIAVPGKGGAMENPGAITFGDYLALLDPSQISVSQRRTLASIMAHELAHIWFGDLVTLDWWDDTWLNESFASWMGDKITHQVYPEFGMNVSEVRSCLGVMNTDARPSTRAIRRPVEATDNLHMSFDELAYSKGQAVLGMAEQWLGPEVLRKGVLDYLKAHAWGTATARDFWTALSEASGENVATTLAPYFDQPGVPEVSAELTLDNHVRLAQRRFANYGASVPDQLWNIPIVLKYFDASGVKTQTVLLTDKEQTVALTSLEGDVAWLLPNAGMKGYYRWSVPPDMLVKLAQHSVDLAVTERVGVIADLNALLDAGTIGGDYYLRTLNNFATDADPDVISMLLSALGKVRSAFVTDDNEIAFAEYVRRTLGPALTRFGLTRQPDETETVTRFRSQLISWLGDEGQDKQVDAYADSLAALYLNDPAAVDPQLAGTVLVLAAAHGDRAFFDECRTRFENATNPTERGRFLFLVGSFRDPALQQEALDYGLTAPLRPMEIFTIPSAMMSYRKNEDMIFNWVLDHYDEIMSHLPPEFGAYMPFVASGCSRERLARAKEFFAMAEHNVPGTNEQLAKVADQVTDCAGLREREGEAVNRYIKEFAASNGGQ